MPSFLKKIRGRWLWLAEKIGDFNARAVLTLLWAVMFVPAGLLVRLLADPLRLSPKEGPRESYWIPHQSDNTTLDAWKRQF